MSTYGDELCLHYSETSGHSESVGSSDVRAIAAGIIGKPSPDALPLKVLRDALLEDGSVNRHPAVEAYHNWITESERALAGEPDANTKQAFRHLLEGHLREGRIYNINASYHNSNDPATGLEIKAMRYADRQRENDKAEPLPNYSYVAKTGRWLKTKKVFNSDGTYNYVPESQKKVPPHEIVDTILQHGGIRDLLQTVIGAHKWSENNSFSEVTPTLGDGGSRT